MTYGNIESDAELKAFRDMIEVTYLVAPDERDSFHARSPVDQIRVLKRNGQIAGGMRLIPLSQWFGGRAVSMGAVSLVGVSPHNRSQGVGTELMRKVLAEMKDNGYAVSALYPATVPLYRRHGWERAGIFYSNTISTKDIDVRDSSVGITEITDVERLKPIYDKHAARCNGMLNRSDITWARVMSSRINDVVHAYVVDDDEGYIVFTQARDGGGFQYNINCRDLVALTERAGRRLWSFLADHRSFVKSIRWGGPPDDPLMMHLSEQYFDTDRAFAWMLRIIDVPTAIAQRGYPAGLTLDFQIDISDDVCPWNNGAWRVVIADGKGEATKGSTADVHADIRGLAACYSGFSTPQRLVGNGLFKGGDAALAKLGGAFAGPHPHLTDWF